MPNDPFLSVSKLETNWNDLIKFLFEEQGESEFFKAL